MAAKKIGLFGGSFNPIHNAHIEIAKASKKYFNLDEVWLIPTFKSPLNSQDMKLNSFNSLSFEPIEPKHRMNMAKIAARNYSDWLKVSNIEIKERKISYTYRTIERLSKKYPDHDFTLIIGDDQFEHFDSWIHPDKIAKIVKIAVYPRLRKFDKKLIKKYSATYMSEAKLFPTRSSVVRQGYFDQIAPDVHQYISRNHLYLKSLVYLNLPDRWEHSLHVAKLAKRFAKAHYKGNYRMQMSAYNAGLLHDISKRWDLDYQKQLVKKYIPEREFHEKVIHSISAGLWLKYVYQLNDDKVVEAIMKHTTGHVKMNKLDKIVYISDKLGRVWKEEEQREAFVLLAERDLDLAYRELFGRSYFYLVKSAGSASIDPLTTEAYFAMFID